MSLQINCRLCLTKLRNGTDIFGTIPSNFDVPLSEVVYKCTSIVMQAADSVPNKACDQCTHFLELWEKFRKRVVEAEEAFRLMTEKEACIREEFKAENGSRYQDIGEDDTNFSSECDGKAPVSNLQEEKEQNSSSMSSPSENPTVIIWSSGQERQKKCRVKLIYSCRQCAMKFNCKESLVHHQHSHSTEEGKSTKHTSTPLHVQQNSETCPRLKKDSSLWCSACEKQFSNQTDFQLHNTTVHRQDNSAKPVTSASGDESDHMELKSAQSGKKIIKCDQCEMEFCGRREWNKHQYVHTGLRRNICDQCGKGFRWPKGLRIHLASHYGEKPQICPVCKKHFTQNTTLKYHMLTHTGERPHQCEICGKGFIQHSNMRRHQLQHKLSADDFACKFCDKKCKSKHGLTLHIKTHENDTS